MENNESLALGGLDNPADADGRPVRHKCLAPGCLVTLDPSRLMCGAHWRLLPKDLQNKIYEAYREKLRGAPGATEKHLALAKDAYKHIRSLP